MFTTSETVIHWKATCRFCKSFVTFSGARGKLKCPICAKPLEKPPADKAAAPEEAWVE